MSSAASQPNHDAMQRIDTLLQKLTELSSRKQPATPIDIDLMLDYTRVLYADLLEWRKNIAFNDAHEQKTVEQAMPPEAPEVPALKQEQRDIRALIGLNDKFRFVSELFGNNKDAYEEVLDELNQLETYDQAVNWLNSKVYHQYGWDDETGMPDSFYHILSQFFSAR
jgi:hypothetical protein